jgi:hypothetical protein
MLFLWERGERMTFRVEWEAVINGNAVSGVESEASWFLVDQQGKMYSYGPMRPVKPIDSSYTKCQPLIKIGKEWFSVREIERRLEAIKEDIDE